MKSQVLTEAAFSSDLTVVRKIALVAFGVAALTVASKIHIPFWPVPLTMQTFAVLTIGAAYGVQLGVISVLAYLALGALGLNVFAGETAGMAALLGGTGGYLFGFALAAGLMGALARRGWDRSFVWTALAMVAGNVVIYVLGLIWLGVTYGWDQPILAWGLYPFLLGDALKIALATALIPLLWRLVGDARANEGR